MCLAFPDVYDIGMSHLGFRILYRILNDDPRTLAERCYTPWVDMQRELVAHGKLLVSLESARPLCDFDVVGFSLQFELTYTNILTMLELGGIPLRSAQRGDDDPLVIAGGPVATHCEPMAPVFRRRADRRRRRGADRDRARVDRGQTRGAFTARTARTPGALDGRLRALAVRDRDRRRDRLRGGDRSARAGAAVADQAPHGRRSRIAFRSPTTGRWAARKRFSIA